MKRMTLTRNLFFTLGLVFSTVVAGDVLLIEPVREVGSMDVPENGMSMSEVESRFGSPESRAAPVGDPPITSWVYERWSVYFEYDAVLFTVLHKGEVLGDESTSQTVTGEETE